MTRWYLVLFLIGLSGVMHAQATTRVDSAQDTSTVSKDGKTNILVIPWYPKMFNASSDVTKAISSNTGENYNQIQESLRKGMCEQVKTAFGAKYNVTSLLDDTAKMNVDLYYAYDVSRTEYISVTAPLNPTTGTKKDVKNGAAGTTTGIKNGEIQVQQQEGDKFMSTIIVSPNLLPHLKKTYKCEYVIFLNQLDMQNELGTDPFNTTGSTDFKRSATLHWTIFSTRTGNRVAMGKNKATFSNTVNTTKKIIDGAFATITKAVHDKFTTAITPKK
jgi:hypothetical protein